MILALPTLSRLIVSLLPADRHAEATPRPSRLPLAPVIAVGESLDPVTRRLLEAARAHRPVALFYQGGSTPGLLRQFTPHALFHYQRGGPVYVAGRCESRQSLRTLRVDRIRLA